MKLIQKFWCMILGTLLMLMPFINVHASTLIERLEAVESEFGVSAEGNLSERVASLEEMLGIVPSPGSTTSERIAALEKDAGLSTEEKYAHEELKTPLSSLEPFTCSYITTNLSSTKCEDKYNNIYNSTLFADASLGFGDNVVEYLLSKEYKELHGVFYIPKKLSSFVEEKDLLMVKVKIYGDDRLLYTMPGMRMKDEPLSFNVNVSGVQFLKIEFEHAVDISGPYVVMGDAELVQ
ncbi:MAG: NPCBM/NEW2 domain-containing protein [Clostridia bacterium]|nr:NPCBM/NEW2 domain-containing protein [Clostridia bacterium]